MVLTSGCIQFPIVNANSNLCGESSLEQLFVLIFQYGKPGFLQNYMDRTDSLAIRNGINDPIVKEFENFSMNNLLYIGFNLRCGSLLGGTSSLR